MPKSIDFGGTSQRNYVFSSPATPLPTIQKRRVVVGSEKRPNKFGVHRKREKVALDPEYYPVPINSCQTSVTESLDILELSAKVPRYSEENQNRIITFCDSQEHQATPLPEGQHKLTNAQSKISRFIVDDLPFEE